MTKDEVISILKRDKALCEFNPMTGERKPLNEDCKQSAEALGYVIAVLEDAPTETEREKSKWIKRDVSLYRCSECGRFSPAQENYCPNCGADMRGA